MRLHAADRLIARLEEHDMSTSVPVTARPFPPAPSPSVRGVIPTYADEHLLWERLAGMKAAGAVPAPDALGVAVFHDEGYVDENPDVEVQLTVRPRSPTPATCTASRCPPRRSPWRPCTARTTGWPR